MAVPGAPLFVAPVAEHSRPRLPQVSEEAFQVLIDGRGLGWRFDDPLPAVEVVLHD